MKMLHPLLLPLVIASAAFAPESSADAEPGIDAAAGCPVAAVQPEAGSRYADPDRNAKVRLRVDPESPTQAAELDARITAQPDNVSLLTARAFLHSRRGEANAAAVLYQRALALDQDPGHVLWSWGWSELNLGRPDCALARWQQARMKTGIPNAFWVGYSYAIAYWALGERELAVRWYDAAAIAAPQRYASHPALTVGIGHWNDRERALAEQVFTAWEKVRADETSGPRAQRRLNVTTSTSRNAG
ncbi:hypothetical protein [Nevskia sp.]|uniref:tetratricopeptide repeat protein n=1 Tax=Nevskia sp. TaxID=1929292 RepID=UPI0025F73833|nr:hypothetical protein [Nevskia sp.]